MTRNDSKWFNSWHNSRPPCASSHAWLLPWIHFHQIGWLQEHRLSSNAPGMCQGTKIQTLRWCQSVKVTKCQSDKVSKWQSDISKGSKSPAQSSSSCWSNAWSCLGLKPERKPDDKWPKNVNKNVNGDFCGGWKFMKYQFVSIWNFASKTCKL